MDREARDHLVLAVTLTSLAGFVDAVGFLRLDQRFVSFMSGDSTQFVVAASQGDWRRAEAAGALVPLFVLGVVAGHLLARACKSWRRPAVLLAEAGLLAIAVVIGSSWAVMAPMVLAMGVQNAAVHRAGDVKLGLTYVTGTLVSLGETLADLAGASDSKDRWAWAPYLLLWIGLVLGATIGALGYKAYGVRVLLAPAALAAGLAAVSALRLALRRRAA